MRKRQKPGAGSAATRFKSGQSGNPKGRPHKPKPPPPSPFAILDEPLTVHEPDSVSELPLEDAMLIKTYQLAIKGGRRAQSRKLLGHFTASLSRVHRRMNCLSELDSFSKFRRLRAASTAQRSRRKYSFR